LSAIGVIGPGRAGQGLAVALVRGGHQVRLHGRRGIAVPPPLVLTWGGPPPWLGEVEVVLVAVRDDAVAAAARDLAAGGRVTATHAVLHLSGMLDETALAPLRTTGASLGCLHPLQAISQPERAPDRLRGALAALTGDARAVEIGAALARSMGMLPVVLAGAAKPRYHAAAAIASNYLVVLAAVAERLMTEAGLPQEEARAGVAALMDGTLANVRIEGPSALTGPIVRGDVETVRAHLAVLPPDLQSLYRVLGRAALREARLPDEAACAMRSLLAAEESRGYAD
jgi:predicted short-subunit dehydrogenase-like oxidoreductase (DUF2520 family)